jgi:hypothetical protein
MKVVGAEREEGKLAEGFGEAYKESNGGFGELY